MPVSIKIGNVPISTYIQNLISSQLKDPNSKTIVTGGSKTQTSNTSSNNSATSSSGSSSSSATGTGTQSTGSTGTGNNTQTSTTSTSSPQTNIQSGGISIGTSSAGNSQNTTTTVVAPPVSKPTTTVSLPFDPSTMSPGEAYARIARLDNSELSITPREQLAATDILNSGYYKETAIYGKNIVFLSSPNQNSPIDEKAIRELTAMSKMPNYSELFQKLEEQGERVVIMVSQYGPSFAAGNVDLLDRNGKTLNVVTLDPNFIDFDHVNPYKRNVLAALSNELHEVASRMQESNQGANYVGSRAFQEVTYAVDQLMENFINSFSANNNVDFAGLSANDRSRVLALMNSWPANTLALNLQRNFNQINTQGGYSRFGSINDARTANLAAVELNNKLKYLLGPNPKVSFVPQLLSNGQYTFVATPISTATN